MRGGDLSPVLLQLLLPEDDLDHQEGGVGEEFEHAGDEEVSELLTQTHSALYRYLPQGGG